MRIVLIARAAVLAGSICVVAACGLVPDPARLTCGDWLALPSEQRLALASQIIDASDQGQSRVRAVAGRSVDVGTQAKLVAWVEASLTKNCDVWPPRSRSVRATFDALYP
jgi:hypothetical protein